MPDVTMRAFNKRLMDYYGRSTTDGRPLFRIIWSPDVLEKRRGTFSKFTPAGVWIGEWCGVDELPKYNYLPHCFILEHLIYYFNPELPDAEKGTYEVLYPFLDKHNRPLPVEWWVVEACIHTRNKGEKSPQKSEDELLQESTKYYEDMLGANDKELLMHKGGVGQVGGFKPYAWEKERKLKEHLRDNLGGIQLASSLSDIDKVAKEVSRG